MSTSVRGHFKTFGHSHSCLAHSYSFYVHPHPCAASLTHFQSKSKYSNPIQPFTYQFSPYLVPVFYVPTYFTYLCANVLSCFTCPCAYVIHFYAVYCLCRYTLPAFMCVNSSGLFIYTAFFKNILVILVLFS